MSIINIARALHSPKNIQKTRKTYNGSYKPFSPHYHKMVVYKTCIKTNLDVKSFPVILDFEPSRTSLFGHIRKGG